MGYDPSEARVQTGPAGGQFTAGGGGGSGTTQPAGKPRKPGAARTGSASSPGGAHAAPKPGSKKPGGGKKPGSSGKLRAIRSEIAGVKSELAAARAELKSLKPAKKKPAQGGHHASPTHTAASASRKPASEAAKLKRRLELRSRIAGLKGKLTSLRQQEKSLSVTKGAEALVIDAALSAIVAFLEK
jgi:hypothetical protein